MECNNPFRNSEMIDHSTLRTYLVAEKKPPLMRFCSCNYVNYCYYSSTPMLLALASVKIFRCVIVFYSMLC